MSDFAMSDELTDRDIKSPKSVYVSNDLTCLRPGSAS